MELVVSSKWWYILHHFPSCFYCTEWQWLCWCKCWISVTIGSSFC